MKKFIAILCFLMVPLQFAYSGVDPNLVVYLPMEEGNGDIVMDASPNGFEAQLNQKDFKWVDGKYGSGIELLNGTEIQLPDADGLDGMKALTLEIWLYQDTHQGTGAIQKGADWPDMSYLMQPWSDQQIYFGIKDTSSRAIAPAGSYPLSKWYHVAATFDGKTLKLFIDGKEEASAEAPVNEVPDTEEPVQVGNRFTGMIDEFVLYDRAVAADEIKSDMKGVDLAVRPAGSLSSTWGGIKLGL